MGQGGNLNSHSGLIFSTRVTHLLAREWSELNLPEPG